MTDDYTLWLNECLLALAVVLFVAAGLRKEHCLRLWRWLTRHK